MQQEEREQIFRGRTHHDQEHVPAGARRAAEQQRRDQREKHKRQEAGGDQCDHRELDCGDRARQHLVN